MPIKKDQALELAAAFRELSSRLGEYRFANWGQLTAAQRRSIEDAEWTLLNYSSDIVTKAVGIALENMSSDLASLEKATRAAKRALRTVKKAQGILAVTASVVALGGAILSQNGAAIAAAAFGLHATAKQVSSAETAQARKV